MNGKQQILDAAIRVMSEVGITPTTEEMTMTNIIRRQAFHSQLDTIHIEDISLHAASCEEVEEAYKARFYKVPADIDMDFELVLWQEQNPMCNPADFVAKDGAYIRDTTPISAEQWEAMHGIGQEPIADERPVMMIRRAIINDTAGHYGRTAFDSVRVWRLYSTTNGEIWGAQWTHFRMANGNVVDWQESTWGTMQHIRQFIEATAELNDVLTEWERY